MPTFEYAVTSCGPTLEWLLLVISVWFENWLEFFDSEKKKAKTCFWKSAIQCLTGISWAMNIDSVNPSLIMFGYILYQYFNLF